MNRTRILKKAILAIHALEALAPEVDFGLTSLAKIRPVHEKTVAANDDVIEGDNAQEGRRIVRDLSIAESPPGWRPLLRAGGARGCRRAQYEGRVPI